jgi:hypothetical protein
MALSEHNKLRELTVVLTQRLGENTSIDWTFKQNVKAKLNAIIKQTLRLLVIHSICRCWQPRLC